jgi:hypothetical protein
MAQNTFKLVAQVTVPTGSDTQDSDLVLDVTEALEGLSNPLGIDVQACTCTYASPGVHNIFADVVAPAGVTYSQIVSAVNTALALIVTAGGNVSVNSCTCSVWAGEPTPSSTLTPVSW